MMPMGFKDQLKGFLNAPATESAAPPRQVDDRADHLTGEVVEIRRSDAGPITPLGMLAERLEAKAGGVLGEAVVQKLKDAITGAGGSSTTAVTRQPVSLHLADEIARDADPLVHARANLIVNGDGMHVG